MSDWGTLLLIAWVFLRIGLLAFGGSTAILPEVERQVVQEHGWLTRQEFVDSFALGQLTPGPALVMVMLPGYRLAGVAGAVVALLAVFLPSAIMCALVTARWEALRGSRWLPPLQRGLAAVTLGLVAAGAFSILRVAVEDAASAVIAVVSFVVLWRWQVHPALMILAGGAAAAAWQLVQ
ncbi:MAG: chromate transporter [Chloroflexota bacterium]